VDRDIFEKIWWDGTELLIYEKGLQSNNKATAGDYIELKGKSTFEYKMPKIMPGRYQLIIRADAYGNENATIQVRIDGKRMGGNINLISGGRSTNPFASFNLGIIEFTRYEGHLLETSSLIPGSMKLDYVRFSPE
jgi:hypothetical protein